MTDFMMREFLKLDIAETSLGRGYWLDQPWVDEVQRPSLTQAAVLALPHLRDDVPGAVFPDGSDAFIARFREMLGPYTTLAVAIRDEDYQELALHSRAWRLPALFVSYVALPIVLNIFSSRIDELLPGHNKGDTAEVTLFIEGENHKTLKFQYKGDPKDLGDVLSKSVPRFIDQLDPPSAPPKLPHKPVQPHKSGK